MDAISLIAADGEAEQNEIPIVFVMKWMPAIKHSMIELNSIELADHLQCQRKQKSDASEDG